jgi:hypothetical protein
MYYYVLQYFVMERGVSHPYTAARSVCLHYYSAFFLHKCDFRLYVLHSGGMISQITSKVLSKDASFFTHYYSHNVNSEKSKFKIRI